MPNQITTDNCDACDSPNITDTCPECHLGYCAVCLPKNSGPHHQCKVAAAKHAAQKVRVVLSALLSGIAIQVDTGYGTVSLRLFQAGETILTPSQEFILLDSFWLGQVISVGKPGHPPIQMYAGSHMSFADVLAAAIQMSDDKIALLAADIALNKANQESRAPRGSTHAS